MTFARAVAGLIGVAAVVAVGIASAQTVKTAPTSATLYKNGLAWVSEEGRGKSEEEWVEMAIHSNPVYGTLRVSAGDDAQVVELVGDPPEFPRLGDLLGGSGKGRMITVDWEGGAVEGEFLGTLLPGSGETNPLVVLKTAAGTTYVPSNRIRKIDVEGGKGPALTGASAPRIRVKLSGGEDGTTHQFQATYLTRSLGWSPAYQLDLSEDDTGRLAMDAVIINDALDLASTQVRFATGEASFPLMHLDSPLVSGDETPEEIMAQVMGDVRRPAYRGAMQAQMYNDIDAQQYQYVGPSDVAASTAQGEETFLYGPKELSLKKGERSLVPLGSGKVKARLVYYWEAPANTSSRDQSGVRLAALIGNAFTFPLTTGPILVTQAGRPLGQGVVKYTRPGGDALVPMSLASSVQCTAEEEESDRSASSVRVGRLRYVKVTVSGTLSVRNMKDRNVTIIIEKNLYGKVVSTTRDGKVEERLLSPFDPNPESGIKWTLDVDKGAETKVRYVYETLVSD